MAYADPGYDLSPAGRYPRAKQRAGVGRPLRWLRWTSGVNLYKPTHCDDYTLTLILYALVALVGRAEGRKAGKQGQQCTFWVRGTCVAIALI